MSTKDSGFSLIEVMIAMGLTGALALTVFKLTEMGFNAQKATETRGEVHQLTQEISGALADRFACKNTLISHVIEIPKLEDKSASIELKEVLDKNNQQVLAIPSKRQGIELLALTLKNYDKKTHTVDLISTFSFQQAKVPMTRTRQIRLMLDMSDGLFQGCVSSTGLLSIDPKEACDYLLGLDSSGKSYFEASTCQFARAVCEKQERVWDGTGCTFSETEKATIKKESCMSLVGQLQNAESYFDGAHCDLQRANCDGIGWSWDSGIRKCNPPEALKKEMEDLAEVLKNLKNSNNGNK